VDGRGEEFGVGGWRSVEVPAVRAGGDGRCVCVVVVAVGVTANCNGLDWNGVGGQAGGGGGLFPRAVTSRWKSRMGVFGKRKSNLGGGRPEDFEARKVNLRPSWATGSAALDRCGVDAGKCGGTARERESERYCAKKTARILIVCAAGSVRSAL